LKKKLSALLVAMIIAATMIISVPLSASAGENGREDGRHDSHNDKSKKHCQWIPRHKEYVNHRLNHHKYWVAGHWNCGPHEDRSKWAS
jgi:hypothetical protein